MANGFVRLSLVVLCLVSLASATQPAAAAGPVPAMQSGSVPSYDHVFVIVMENHSYGEIIGSSAAPYINSLLPHAALGTAYHAVTHPSLPNYLALTAGSTYGITTDCTACWLSAPNLGDSVESAGKTWKAYEESMPSACFVGDSYPYAQKHDPFIYFNDVRTNTSRCQSHVVPYSNLATDLASTATTPNFAFITPNICNDMHDCSVGTGDSWLASQVPGILASPAFTLQHSLLALVWDEDDSSGSNQVPLLLLGSGVAAGRGFGTPYNHYSLLRTIELALGTSWLTTNDENTAPMSDAFDLAAPVNIGGVATSGPAVSSWGVTRSDVFVRGQDNALWHSWSTGSSWAGWYSLGGVLTSDATAVSWAPGRIDVFARGQDGALWHNWLSGGTWAGWYSLGGVLTSGPDVASWGAGRLDVFALGQNSGLWHIAWSGGGWSGWQSIGGSLTSDPAAVSWGPKRIDVFARGQGNALMHLYGDGASWSTWQSLGGSLNSGAAASSCGSGRLNVFALDSSSSLVEIDWTAYGWSAWKGLGTQSTVDPGAVCIPGGSTVQLSSRAADGTTLVATLFGT